MGTRSKTQIIDASDNKVVVQLYIQFDGYPDGVGMSLASFANGMEIVNGFNSTHKFGSAANGVGCFAAQLISHLKRDRIGNVYVEPVDESKEEYNYQLFVKEGEIRMKMDGGDEKFEGTPAEFIAKYGEVSAE